MSSLGGLRSPRHSVLDIEMTLPLHTAVARKTTVQLVVQHFTTLPLPCSIPSSSQTARRVPLLVNSSLDRNTHRSSLAWVFLLGR